MKLSGWEFWGLAAQFKFFLILAVAFLGTVLGFTRTFTTVEILGPLIYMVSFWPYRVGIQWRCQESSSLYFFHRWVYLPFSTRVLPSSPWLTPSTADKNFSPSLLRIEVEQKMEPVINLVSNFEMQCLEVCSLFWALSLFSSRRP